MENFDTNLQMDGYALAFMVTLNLGGITINGVPEMQNSVVDKPQMDNVSFERLEDWWWQLR